MRGRMWPYTVRLNTAGTMAAMLMCLGVYLLYTASMPSALRHFEDEPLGPQDVGEREELFAETINLKKLLVAGIKAAEAGGHQVYDVRQHAADMQERSKGLTKEGAKQMVSQGDLRSHWVMVEGLAASFTGLQIISEEKPTEEEVDNLSNKLDTIKPFHERDFVSYARDIRVLPHDTEVALSDITVWIDPLDATQEYTEHNSSLLKYVTTMVCVAVNGKPTIGIVHAPFENKTYWSWVGQGVSDTVKALTDQRRAEQSSRPERIIVSRSHSGGVADFLKTQLGKDVLAGKADAYVHKTLIKKWDICAPNALVDSVGGKMTDLVGHRVTYSYMEEAENPNGVLATSALMKHRELLSKLKQSAA
ncbi:Inositol monophosphatase 3 [Halotydeus destructor]|nr:Inositol monophosphatase 3 [Halotydeus destructor]